MRYVKLTLISLEDVVRVGMCAMHNAHADVSTVDWFSRISSGIYRKVNPLEYNQLQFIETKIETDLKQSEKRLVTL